MGGEYGLGPAALVLVDILCHRPGDRQPVERAGAPPDLVQQHQAAFVALLRIFAVSFISTMNVLCPRARLSLAPTRVNIRSTRQISASAGRHKPAHMGHQHDQTHLAQHRALTRHIGAGEHDNLFLARYPAGCRWARNSCPAPSAPPPGDGRRGSISCVAFGHHAGARNCAPPPPRPAVGQRCPARPAMSGRLDQPRAERRQVLAQERRTTRTPASHIFSSAPSTLSSYSLSSAVI